MFGTKTKQNRVSRDGFLFVGNHLALDFLNTRPILKGMPTELLPDFSALLRWSRAADLISSRDLASLQRRWGESARAKRVVAGIWKLREMLRKEVLAWENGDALHRSTVKKLNGLMAGHPLRTRLEASGSRPSREVYFILRCPEDLFAPLAHAAAALFTNVDRDRVRKCDQCILHFHDTSKKGTRRWCSMQICGNRMKVAAYAARKRRRPRAREGHAGYRNRFMR